MLVLKHINNMKNTNRELIVSEGIWRILNKTKTTSNSFVFILPTLQTSYFIEGVMLQTVAKFTQNPLMGLRFCCYSVKSWFISKFFYKCIFLKLDN